MSKGEDVHVDRACTQLGTICHWKWKLKFTPQPSVINGLSLQGCLGVSFDRLGVKFEQAGNTALLPPLPIC